MYQKVMDVIEKSKKPLSTSEISKKLKLNLFETRRQLERLQEEGRIESFGQKGKICWKVKETDKETEKYEKMGR